MMLNQGNNTVHVQLLSSCALKQIDECFSVSQRKERHQLPQIRDMTRRTRGISLTQMIEELASYLLGWRGSSGFCQIPRVLSNLEAWIRRRLPSYLWRQWQNGHNRFNCVIVAYQNSM
jgi:hypothetical protein